MLFLTIGPLWDIDEKYFKYEVNECNDFLHGIYGITIWKKKNWNDKKYGKLSKLMTMVINLLIDNIRNERLKIILI